MIVSFMQQYLFIRNKYQMTPKFIMIYCVNINDIKFSAVLKLLLFYSNIFQ